MKMKNISTLDDFTKKVVIKEGYDSVVYNKLNEDSKKDINENLLRRVFESVKEKSLKFDYSFVKESKGDITRLNNYEDLKDAIELLMNLYRHDKNAIDDIPELKRAIDNVEHYKRDFMRGFKNNNTLVKLMYNNIVTAIIVSTSDILAEFVEYVKVNSGMKKFRFKKDVKRTKGLFLDNIKSFNKMVIKGQLDSYLKVDSDKIAGTTALVLAGVAIVTVMIGIWLLREIVYILYQMRSSISDRLLHLSYTVELNSKKDKLTSRTKEKQEKIAKKLKDLSDKIAVDSRVSKQRGESELENDNKDLNMDDLKQSTNGNLL